MKSLRALIGKQNIGNTLNSTSLCLYILWPASSECQYRLESKGYTVTRLTNNYAVFLMTIDDLKSVYKMLSYEGLRYDLLKTNFVDKEKLKSLLKKLNSWADLDRHFDYLGIDSIDKVI